MGGKKKRRAWPWILAGAVAACAALALYVVKGNGTAAEWNDSFRAVTVESVVYRESVEVSGSLEPFEVRELVFPVSGMVAEVAVGPGDKVARDTVLVRLEDTLARFELAAIESSLEQKRLTASPREIRLAEMERDIKARAVTDRLLRSPINGRVSSIDVHAGDFVPAGRRVVRVVNVSALKAKVQIDELDAPRVKVGMPVRFSFDALPEAVIEGRVYSLLLEGRINNEGLSVLDGEVLIDRPPEKLLSGYSFTGQILLGEEQQVLALPVGALSKQGGSTYVYRLTGDGGNPQRLRIEARLLDAERIQVLSGLQAGDRVLAASDPGSPSGNGRLTTTGLLNSIRNRARVPIFGGASSKPGGAEGGGEQVQGGP